MKKYQNNLHELHLDHVTMSTIVPRNYTHQEPVAIQAGQGCVWYISMSIKPDLHGSISFDLCFFFHYLDI